MGQIASNLGNSNVTDPRQARPQDLDSSEMGARLIAQGTRGLAQGFQNYQGQGQAMRGFGGMAQINPLMTQQPQVQLPGMQPQRRGQNDLNFYGSSY